MLHEIGRGSDRQASGAQAIGAPLTIEDGELGIRGRLDAMRRRDGTLYPVEHKRGRCRKDADGKPDAWDSDRLQALAYAMLLEKHTGQPVTEARIRYHASNVTVRVPVTDQGRADELEREEDRAAPGGVEPVCHASSVRRNARRPQAGRCVSVGRQ